MIDKLELDQLFRVILRINCLNVLALILSQIEYTILLIHNYHKNNQIKQKSSQDSRVCVCVPN